MQGNWSFMRESPASPDDLDLKTTTELHPPGNTLVARRGAARQVRMAGCGSRCSCRRNRAEELCDAFAGSDLSRGFGELIGNGALMAPASYAALRLAIARERRPGQIARAGADDGPDAGHRSSSSRRRACDALCRLVDPGILEVTDAGLALEGGLDSIKLDLDVSPQIGCSPKGPIPARSPVIIAIIDDGIGIANHRFREQATETRIKHFLDLSTARRADGGGGRRRAVGPELDSSRYQ